MATQGTVETGSEGQDTVIQEKPKTVPLDEQIIQQKDVPDVISDVVEPVQHQMQNIHSVDEDGNLNWFPRDVVTKLRGESEKRRLQLREREEKITTLEQAVTERETVEETARIAQLQEQEKFQELANEYQQKYEDVQTEMVQRDIQLMRMRVAGEVGLPSELADRLIGETEESIRQDAERLAELVAVVPDNTQQPMRTTQVVPGGGTPARTDEDRRREYFSKSGSSSVFPDDTEGHITHSRVKDT